MFFISDSHPFLDGNGRIARIMMNAELTLANQARIIIPTVFREDYLLSLRRLSRQGDPEAYIKMMLRAYEFTHLIDFSNYETALITFKNCNAFSRPHEAKLIMPKK
jgi:Fic family protein